MTSPLFESVARTMSRSVSVGTYSDYPTILAALTARYKNDAELLVALRGFAQQLPDDWRDGMSDDEILAVFTRVGARQ